MKDNAMQALTINCFSIICFLLCLPYQEASHSLSQVLFKRFISVTHCKTHDIWFPQATRHEEPLGKIASNICSQTCKLLAITKKTHLSASGRPAISPMQFAAHAMQHTHHTSPKSNYPFHPSPRRWATIPLARTGFLSINKTVVHLLCTEPYPPQEERAHIFPHGMPGTIIDDRAASQCSSKTNETTRKKHGVTPDRFDKHMHPNMQHWQTYHRAVCHRTGTRVTFAIRTSQFKVLHPLRFCFLCDCFPLLRCTFPTELSVGKTCNSQNMGQFAYQSIIKQSNSFR